jgi:hypothetical protein
MNVNTKKQLELLKLKYDQTMEIMEHGAAKAIKEEGRAYGGFVRMAKGKIQEYMTEQLVRISWRDELGQSESRLLINSDKIKIPVRNEYIERIEDKSVREYIIKNLSKFYYGLSVDKHVFIDRKFVIGIECKAYTENAMIKRILVDFHLLKTKYPKLKCLLFQLESQLGGDYGEGLKSPKGSSPTHSIMSYFDAVDLTIVTLLEGDRKVDRPINKPEFFKELKIQHLETAIEKLIIGMQEFKKT